MKQATLAAVICLAFAALGLAQGGPDACSFSICLEDKTCTDATSCVNFPGCERTSFTVPCTDDYSLKASTSCSTGSCGMCQGCVVVYQVGNYVGECHTSSCGSGICVSYCPPGSQGTIHLTQGTTYTLFVCMIPCPDQDPPSSCDNDYCHSNCKAIGMVYLNSSECPSP